VFFLLKIAPSHGRSGLPPTTCFIVPPESTTQTESRLVQPFLLSSRQRVVGHAGHDLPKIASLYGESCFVRPTRVHSHTSSAVCARLTSECHRACRCPSPSILPVPVTGPHLRRGSLDQPDLASQTTSRFRRHSSRRTAPILYNGRPFFPKIVPSHVVIWTRPSRPTTQTASPSVQPFLHSSPQCLYNLQ